MPPKGGNELVPSPAAAASASVAPRVFGRARQEVRTDFPMAGRQFICLRRCAGPPTPDRRRSNHAN